MFFLMKSFRTMFRCHQKENIIPSKNNQFPEDFELLDDEPATVNLNEEPKLTSKLIAFDCPICKISHMF